MKKLLLFTLLFSFIFSKAQEQSKMLPYVKETEIKTNGLYMALGYYNLGYEYLLNKNLGIGVSIFSKKNDNFPKSIYNISSRYYFGKTFGKSIFFVEGAFLFYNLKPYLNNYQYSKVHFAKIFYSGIGYKQFIIGGIFIEAFVSGIVYAYVPKYKDNIPTHAGLSLGVRF